MAIRILEERIAHPIFFLLLAEIHALQQTKVVLRERKARATDQLRHRPQLT